MNGNSEQIEEAERGIASDVEVIDESGGAIERPFNPNDVKIVSEPMNVGQLMDRVKHNEINFDTEFQRLFVWDEKRQSQLIESLILRLPIPSFYFDGEDDSRWQIIDGLQRMTTFKRYIVEEEFALKGLEFLRQYDGKRYSELPRELIRRIDTYPLSVYVLPSGSSPEVKYNIFSRINRGGITLKPQEIRHALNQGIAANLVKELAESREFLLVTENKIKPLRMDDRDFVTRFAAFYLTSYTKYEPDMDNFMNKAMRIMKGLSSEEIDRLKADFRRAMLTAYEIFGNDAFRKRLDYGEPRKPINKALFEVLSVSFANLPPEKTSELVERKDEFREALRENMAAPSRKLINAITSGTALKDMVHLRYEIVKEIINKTLHDS